MSRENEDRSSRVAIENSIIDANSCDWSGIAWSLPAGQALRARIEDNQRRLRAAETALATASADNAADGAELARRDDAAARAGDVLERNREDRRAVEAPRAIAAAALEEGLRAAGTVTKAQLEEVPFPPFPPIRPQHGTHPCSDPPPTL